MKEILEKFEFYQYRDGMYYDGYWDYMFDPFKNILYSHCEVKGDLTFLAKVKNEVELELALKALNIDKE
jgi:hypothetical protein